ncbi:MAG: glycosyltransferase family 2 protein [Candidatus Niyogibacteria bacterium]|nr:glycosyltransferase family 2 protein [Candidatus Niyogibacteria bacterium]
MQKISIVIPVYRDSLVIGKTIDTLFDFANRENLDLELIVVNDGGNDGGADVVRKKIRVHPSIRLIDRKINRGKGFSIREGLRIAQRDYIFYTDADLPYLTEPIRQMLDLLMHKNIDLILANRELSHAIEGERPPLARRITHWVYSRFVKLFIPFEFNDTLAGLKGMKKRVAERIVPKLTIDRFSFDIELLLAAKLAKFNTHELPVSLKNVGKSNLNILRDAPQMSKDVIAIAIRHYRGCYK